jgi:uncharacterized protein YerC
MKNEHIKRITYGLPLLSDFPTRQQWEAATWEILTERLVKVTNLAELKEILQFLLSPHERHTLTYRALAASRIQSHISYSEIGQELWLSPQTISALKKSLIEGEYKSSYARGHKKKDFVSLVPDRKPKVRYRSTKYGQSKLGVLQ